MAVHLHSSDPRFCGSTTPGRQFTPDDAGVTCAACRSKMDEAPEPPTHFLPRFMAHGEGHAVVRHAEYEPCLTSEVQSRLDAFLATCQKEKIDIWHVTVNLTALVRTKTLRIRREG